MRADREGWATLEKRDYQEVAHPQQPAFLNINTRSLNPPRWEPEHLHGDVLQLPQLLKVEKGGRLGPERGLQRQGDGFEKAVGGV